LTIPQHIAKPVLKAYFNTKFTGKIQGFYAAINVSKLRNIISPTLAFETPPLRNKSSHSEL